MQLHSILLFITVFTEAKKLRSNKTRSKTDDDTRDLEIEKKIDVYPDKFIHPVPFGHIYREGVEDPHSNYKQPLDFMDLDTIFLKDGPVARELIENHDKSFQRVKKPLEKPLKYLSPKDEFLDGEKDLGDDLIGKNITRNSFWNIAAIQQRNFYDPPKFRVGGGKMPNRPQSEPFPEIDHGNKADFFAKASFGLGIDELKEKQHFTSCDEFGKNANFHPNDIVNLDWVPFYIWTHELSGRVTVPRVHRFTYPTKKLVVQYKTEFGPYLNKTIDWEQPKLLLKCDIMEMLLIAADRKGLFIGIPHQEIPVEMKHMDILMPTIQLRLKIVDPYLGMLYCDIQYANIMAVSGSEPPTESKRISEAATLKMRGVGFAVQRDIEMEQMEARAKAFDLAEREKDKIITIDDQLQ